MSRRRAAVLAWLLAAAAALAVPTPASAQGAGLPAVRSACDAAIARRLTDLGALKPRIDAAGHITASDRSSLDTQIGAAVAGLGQLRSTIDADTALAKLRADCRAIVTGFRVYLVLVPKAHLVVAADRALAAGDALTRLDSLLGARVTAAQSAGKDVTSAKGYVSDVVIKVQAARSAASGVPPAVLPLQATGYPANRPVLVSARATLASAQSALQGALQDAQLAINALK